MVVNNGNFVSNEGGVLNNVAIGIGNTVDGNRQPSEPWSFDGSNRSVNAGSIAPGAVITTGDGNNIVGFSRSGERGVDAPTFSPAPSPAPSTPVQGNAGWVGAVAQGAGQAFSYMAKGTLENAGKAAGAFAQGFQQSFGQQGSMGATQTQAYQGRTQPAAANPQQGGFSQRQTTASVNQPETLSQRFGNVFKNAAGYGLVAVAASGGVLLAPVAVAAVAVIAAYKAIQALEAVMNLFKGANKGQQTTQQQQQQQAGQPQGQQQAPSGQQQQQQQAGNRASGIHTFMGDVYLASLEESIRAINKRSSQRIKEEEEAAKRAAQDGQQAPAQGQQPTPASQGQQQGQEQTGQQARPPVAQAQPPVAQATAQAPAPVQGEQQPTDQQLAIPGLETAGNANGGTNGIQFTQDVNLGSVQASSAPSFDLDVVFQSMQAGMGSR